MDELRDPGANWCPDCGERSDVCTCAPELPFAGYWEISGENEPDDFSEEDWDNWFDNADTSELSK